MMKALLLDKITKTVTERIENAQYAIKMAQQSANEEGKSSMGDKYETARAMGQLTIEMITKQLLQAQQDLHVVTKIDTKNKPEIAISGAVVETTLGFYFIAISAGFIEIDAQKFMVISPQSPIGQLLMGKRVGEEFIFRAKTEKILKIS